MKNRAKDWESTVFDSLFSDIDSLTLYGGVHPKIFGYYRMLSKRFPYAIYYKLMEGYCKFCNKLLYIRRDEGSMITTERHEHYGKST